MANSYDPDLPGTSSSKRRPTYLPMSDNEDTNEENEPYSKAYHDRISQQAALIVNADDEDSRFPTYLDESQLSSSPSVFPMASVRPLNSNSNLSSLKRKAYDLDEQTNSSNSLSGDYHGEVNTLLLDAPVRRVFGIAQNHATTEPSASNGNNNEALLAELQTKAKKPRMRRNTMVGRPAASSKLNKMRNQLNQMRFRTLQRSRLEIRPTIGSSAPTTDEQTDPEDLGENTSHSVPSTSRPEPASTAAQSIQPGIIPTSPTVSSVTVRPMNITKATNRRKTIHQPIAHEEIEFIENLGADWSPSLYRQQLHNVKNIPNPNLDLLKKVAFLRSCANFMMFKLGIKPFVFKRDLSVDEMMEMYENHRTM